MSKSELLTDSIKVFPAYVLGRVEYIAASITALIALVVYTMTLTPSVSAGDNGELTTAMFFLGVAHAPSYPLHSFMGHLTMLLPIHNVGWRSNFFSAFCGSLTIFFSVLVYIKLLGTCGIEKSYAVLAGFVTGLAFTFSETLWSQAIMCEVYTMSSVFFPLLILILMRWQDEVQAHRHDEIPYFGEKYLLAYALLFGVGMAGHQTILVTSVFGFCFIVFTLIDNLVVTHRLTGSQLAKGILLLTTLVVLMGIAFGVYYLKIVSLSSNLYDTDNVKAGMITYLVCNFICLFIYLYYRFVAVDQADPKNYLQKAFFVVVKMFWLFNLGYFINFYMFIRAHGGPPINWMGINEVHDVWLKFGKFFNAVWRKQYGDMGKLPFSPYNISIETKLLFTKLLAHQYSYPLYAITLVGLIYSFFKFRFWFYLTLIGFFSYNVIMVYFLRYYFDDRSLSFVIVFFIFVYFIVTIPMAFGVALVFKGLDKAFSFLDNKKSV